MISVLPLELPAGAVAFSTMRGSVRPGDPYSGFNTCDYTGDDPAHVAACRCRLASYLGISEDDLIMARQTHSDRVAVITRHAPRPSLYGIDALVTAESGMALCIHTADCVPGVLYDPVARVIGAFHSGWRGTLSRIAAHTVTAMTQLGAEPARMYAALGPCICAGCFEIGPEVALPLSLIAPVSWLQPRPHADLRQSVAATLRHAGLLLDHIAAIPPCSRCTPDIWSSARTSGIASSRTTTLIMLP